MDSDVDIMYVPSKEKRITRHSLKVKLCRSHNRQKLPSPLEARIDETWNRRITDNPTMFNGSKFRIASVSESSGDVTFNLGITSYKEFIGTNWSPDAKTLRQLGNEHFANTQVLNLILSDVYDLLGIYWQFSTYCLCHFIAMFVVLLVLCSCNSMLM